MITGKSRHSWRGFSDTFINPCSARVLSSPDESGVTSKTPRNPRPQGEEGVSSSKYIRYMKFHLLLKLAKTMKLYRIIKVLDKHEVKTLH